LSSDLRQFDVCRKERCKKSRGSEKENGKGQARIVKPCLQKSPHPGKANSTIEKKKTGCKSQPTKQRESTLGPARVFDRRARRNVVREREGKEKRPKRIGGKVRGVCPSIPTKELQNREKNRNEEGSASKKGSQTLGPTILCINQGCRTRRKKSRKTEGLVFASKFIMSVQAPKKGSLQKKNARESKGGRPGKQVGGAAA